MRKSLMDTEVLQRLQNQFCNANDIYLVCLNRDREVLASCQCADETIQFFSERISRDSVSDLLSSVELSQVEAVMEEALELPYLKLCSVVTRVEGATALIWLVIAVLKEHLSEDLMLPESIRVTTEERFYRTIALLEEVSKQLMRGKEQEQLANEALEQSVASESKCKEQMLRSEAMATIVHMLGSDDAFSYVANAVIQEICKVLHIEGGCLVRDNADGIHLDVLCEYTQSRSWSLANRLHGQKRSAFPFGDGRAYMLSSDSMMPDEMEEFFRQFHLQAGLFHPIEVNGADSMYLCLYEFEKTRTWTVDDIKFISDIKKVLQTILARRIVKNSLAGSYASLESVLENVGCGIVVVDYEKQQILYSNQITRGLIPNPESMLSRPNRERKFGPREYYIDRSKKWVEACQTEIDWVDGRKVCLATLYDITETKLYQKQIEAQISSDPLTGVYNRMRCEKDLETHIQNAQLTGKEGAYLCVDLDDFQNINDGLGHQYGDTLLKAIAYNITRVKGVSDCCYRMGGDEFGIIVSDEEYKNLSRIVRDIRGIFDKPWFLNGEDYYCTMCMSVVRFPTDAGSVSDLIRKSNVALHTAKKKGKGTVEYYNEKVEDTSYYRLDLEKNMRRATLNECVEFEVYYQPIFDQNKQGDRCCGAEALVRWNSPELGFISPADFIPLAEYLGLINQIGDHVLLEAAKRCKYWNDCGHPDYKVNVNLSVMQLLQNDFVKKLQKVLENTRIIPKNLTLEVTESLAINDMNRIKKILEQIKTLGVKVALDDFGTGYSSLNHIRELPIDVLKIDRCFVENLAEDEFSGAFVKMVSELAKTIGVTVCAEGVEERKQLEVLNHMNVRLVQGYYYGKPMPVQDFEKTYL